MRTRLRRRLYAACVLILAAGLSCAGWIYARAGDAQDFSGAYQIIVVDGVPQAIAPNESKAYVRDLQRYGGKMAIVLDEINRWFASLWHGKSLALTVAFLSVFVSLTLYFIALLVPEDSAAGRDR